MSDQSEHLDYATLLLRQLISQPTDPTLDRVGVVPDEVFRRAHILVGEMNRTQTKSNKNTSWREAAEAMMEALRLVGEDSPQTMKAILADIYAGIGFITPVKPFFDVAVGGVDTITERRRPSGILKGPAVAIYIKELKRIAVDDSDTARARKLLGWIKTKENELGIGDTALPPLEVLFRPAAPTGKKVKKKPLDRG